MATTTSSSNTEKPVSRPFISKLNLIPSAISSRR
jgi:hypothetical protein